MSHPKLTDVNLLSKVNPDTLVGGVSSATNMYLEEAAKKLEGQKKSHQQELAQFYTPKELRDWAWETINVPANSKVLEPSAGSGEWLDDIAKRKYADVTANDFDPVVFNQFKESWETKGIKPMNQDYLTAKFPEKFDLIVGNPPYFLMKGDRAPSDEIKTKFKSVLKGVPDIYGLFVVKAIEDLAPNGVASFIIPVSLLTSPAFQKMRNFIHTNANIERVSISKRLDWFKNAKVEVMAFQVRKTTPTNDYISKIGENIIFVPKKDAAASEYKGERLKDLVDIKIGNFDPSKVNEEDTKKHLSAMKKEGTVPILSGENIGNEGGLVLDKKLKGTRNQYVESSYKTSSKVDAPFLIMNRTIGKGKKITVSFVKEGSFYPENHTIYMKSSDPNKLRKAYEVLSDKDYQKIWTENVRGHVPTLSAEFLRDVPVER